MKNPTLTHRILAFLLAPLLLLSLSPPLLGAVTGRSADSSIAGTEKLLSDSSGTDTYITVSTLLGSALTGTINGLTVTSSTGTLTIPNGVTLTGPAASGTVLTADGSATVTNKAIDLTDNTLSGTSLELLTALSDETGTGAAVFGTSPTIASPVFSGSISGTYTFAGTPTFTAPVLSGSITGTYTLAGTPTITSPTITGPSISGTSAYTGAITTTGTVIQTSASATAFESGLNGGTNPVFRLVNNIASQATGISITGRAEGAGADITVLSSGTNENLVVNAKGSGTITLNPTGTGNIILGRAATTAFTLTQTSASATAFESGLNGGTNPVFRLVNNIASQATGISITGRAAAAGADITVISSGTNEQMNLDAKGSGGILLNGTGTGAVLVGDATNPALSVVHTTEATGLKITSAAEGSGVALAAISSGTNESATIDAKGSGTLLAQGTATGAFLVADATNPAFSVVHTTEGTGLKVTSAAAASGVALAAISSGTDENFTIDAKGAGTITLNGTGTGNVVLGRAATTAYTLTQTSASATAFESGLNGGTNPVFRLVNNIASQATGISITGRAAAAGADITVLSSGTNEQLNVNAKGSGAILLNGTATGAVLVGDATTPALSVVHTTEGTGLGITSAAAASGLAVAAISSGTNESMTLDAKGTGTVSIGTVSTGDVIISNAQVTPQVTVISGDGAITIESGMVVLTKGSAAAITLAAPSSQNGKMITITSTTDFAHVVTVTGGMWDGTATTNTTVTFPVVAGAAVTLMAYGTDWYVINNQGTTVAP